MKKKFNEDDFLWGELGEEGYRRRERKIKRWEVVGLALGVGLGAHFVGFSFSQAMFLSFLASYLFLEIQGNGEK